MIDYKHEYRKLKREKRNLFDKWISKWLLYKHIVEEIVAFIAIDEDDDNYKPIHYYKLIDFEKYVLKRLSELNDNDIQK